MTAPNTDTPAVALKESGPITALRASIPGETEAAGRAILWKYRCWCGKRFTNTYGRGGTAYCPKISCQRTCIAEAPVEADQ